MFIRATGNISPQKTFGHPVLLADPVEYSGNRMHCAEPDYKDHIDAKLIRRMSRIIRMGVAAAMECLKEAAIEQPGAIVTGTAYGCLEDTGQFITRMVENNEELLTPTAFIQSTHNTIGAQIGLMLHCNHYNNAFVHRGFSFESALTDAIMLLREHAAPHVLVGAIDEITDISHCILNRMGLYKQEPVNSLQLFNTGSKGTVAGEGSSFFVLASESSSTDYARLDALSTFYKPAGAEEVLQQINSFLENNGITANDIDLVISGRNGDASSDRIYDMVRHNIFSNTATVQYKHLCGEYPTATGFALWLAACMLKSQEIPAVLKPKGPEVKQLKKVLVYNHYLDIHHSLFLVSAC